MANEDQSPIPMPKVNPNNFNTYVEQYFLDNPVPIDHDAISPYIPFLFNDLRDITGDIDQIDETPNYNENEYPVLITIVDCVSFISVFNDMDTLMFTIPSGTAYAQFVLQSGHYFVVDNPE
jgi:hypothetical protein